MPYYPGSDLGRGGGGGKDVDSSLFELHGESASPPRYANMKLSSATMTSVIWSALWKLSAALLQTGPRAGGATPPVASTSSGRIHGTVDPALPNVHQYLGIPYAEPPIGDRRWAPPEALNQGHVEIQATQLPPSCMQYLTELGDTIYTRDVLEYNLQGLNTTGAVSEDCLTLSVWAPADAAANATAYPVLIFVHGGAFGTGGQNVPYQIPAQWVDRDPHHIVVSFHYRLNIFGFPSAAGLAAQSQNLGLLDQRAAVAWLRANVAAFGGDPDQMVLWGNSAGAIAVDYYGFAYPADPIVRGLIMDSGTAFSPTPTNDTTYANFTFVAENVGCAGLAEDPVQQVACMRGVDADTIEEFIAAYQDSGEVPTILFRPFYDEKLVFSNYTARAEAGLQAHLVSPEYPSFLPLLLSSHLFTRVAVKTQSCPSHLTTLALSSSYFLLSTS